MSDVSNTPTEPETGPQEVPQPEVPTEETPAEVNQPAEGATAQPQQTPFDPNQQVQPGAGGKTPEEVAREVLAGHWGRGHRREERLELAGYSKAAVQTEISRLLGTDEFQGVENQGLQNTLDTREPVEPDEAAHSDNTSR